MQRSENLSHDFYGINNGLLLQAISVSPSWPPSSFVWQRRIATDLGYGTLIGKSRRQHQTE